MVEQEFRERMPQHIHKLLVDQAAELEHIILLQDQEIFLQQLPHKEIMEAVVLVVLLHMEQAEVVEQALWVLMEVLHLQELEE